MDKNKMIYRRERVLNWIQLQGAVFTYDEAAERQVKYLFYEVFRVFPEYIKRLSAIYIYDQNEQPEDLRVSDAIHWQDVTFDIGTLHAIGLSLQAIERGASYSILCILHEMTHMVGFLNHDGKFHGHLDGLIGHYNAATGKNIKNDYQGL